MGEKLYDEIQNMMLQNPNLGFVNFHETFDLGDFYTTSGTTSYLSRFESIKEENSEKMLFKKFIKKAFEIYKEFNGKDYSEISRKDLLVKYIDFIENNKKFTIQTLSKSTGIPEGTLLKIRFKSFAKSNSPLSGKNIDIYESLELDLLKKNNDFNTFFNDIRSYKELKRLVMRYLVGDGINFKTIGDLENLIGKDYNHLENYCHEAEKYLDAIKKLTDNIQEYTFDLPRIYDRDGRSNDEKIRDNLHRMSKNNTNGEPPMFLTQFD